jgi:hypothetical protein
MLIYYKVLVDGKSCHGGEFKWNLPVKQEDGSYIPGEWHTFEGEIKLCQSGFHLTDNPLSWHRPYSQTYICEYDDSLPVIKDNIDKIVVQKCRLLHPVNDCVKSLDGSESWYKDGKRHRDNDLPAVIFSNGGQKWYKEGNLHRDNDLPAIIRYNGSQYWYKDGNCHRDNDLPAVIFSDGSQEWYKNGELHRDNDLPAAILSNGSQYWYKNGNLHRDDNLPAIIRYNGSQEWWKKGQQYII